jgi:DNA polymerase type B, organellar and viral
VRDRVPHIIRGNKSGAAPQKWIVLDTETLPIQLEKHRWQHVYRLAVAAFWSRERESRVEQTEFQRFGNSESLCNAIAEFPKSKERVGVVAHNMDYDAQVLDIHCRLRELGYRLTKATIDRGKWVQRWQRGGKGFDGPSRTLLWIDLGNFFPIPLRELASWLGMAKWSMPDMDAPDEDWYRYCEQDVRIELAALKEWLAFCDENDLGYFAPTIAGQAFNAFRHRFMEHEIYVHVHPDVQAIEAASYFGGRCQELFRGRAPKRKYAHVDVNSMYASVMAENEFPVKQVGHYGPMTPTQLAALLTRFHAIARVRVETDVPAFPLRRQPRTLYPIGSFVTTLPTPELSLALEYGYLRDVEEVVTYEHAPVFRSYVAHFWNHRLEAKMRGDTWAAKNDKGFLTSLYGKFGQRIFTSELVATDVDRRDEIWAEYDADDRTWYEYRSLAGRVERRVREVYGRDTLIAIPAHVTSYARVKLWRLMVEAGLDNVLYVDTDSLIVHREALDRLWHYVESEALGGLRLIGQTETLYIRAPKWYRFGHKEKRSGVSWAAKKVDWDKFEQDDFRNLKWALRHEFSCSAIVEEVQINAPYRNLLPQHSLGHRIEWPRADEEADSRAHSD